MGTGPEGRKEQLRARLARGRESFLAAVAALEEADLDRRVFADGGDWTARDLIGHVSYAEAGMLTLIRATLAGAPAQADPTFDIDRFNAGRVRRAREQSLSEILARLDTSRADTLALLEGLSDADLDRAVHHPVAGATTVEGVFRIIPFHERTHAKDLAGLKGAGSATA